ncbi:MAG: hypothetical protein ACI3XQ_06525 [Eubacteriales bacterium]
MTSKDFRLAVFEIGGVEAVEFFESWKRDNVTDHRYNEELLEQFEQDFGQYIFEVENGRRPSYASQYEQ